MRTTALIAPAVLMLALAGCGTGGPYRAPGPVSPVTPGYGGEPPASPLARSVSYVCEDLTRVTLTEGQRMARATLNSGLDLSLAPMGGLVGSRYGAPPYEFRALGSEGQWINQGRVFRCRVG
jgi:hypothetical protein